MISIAFAVLASAPAEEQEFSFKFFRGSGTYSVASLKEVGCKQRGDRFDCDLTTTVADYWAFIQYTIVDQKLTSMIVSGKRTAIPDLLPQLEGKYGTPCKVGRNDVVTGLGARLPSVTITWCFKTGTFEFREIGLMRDTYALEYRAYSREEPKAIAPSDF
jgi:hypothetical protein